MNDGAELSLDTFYFEPESPITVNWVGVPEWLNGRLIYVIPST